MTRQPQITAALMCGVAVTMTAGANTGMDSRMACCEVFPRSFQNRRFVGLLAVVIAKQTAAIVGHPHDFAWMTSHAFARRDITLHRMAAGGVMRLFVLAV